MIAEREVFLKENGGIKNGFYTRNFDTLLGKLEDLKIPRDREGNFKTKLIEPYKRRDISLDELIFGMFARGMSARAIAQTLEVIFELKYSPSTKKIFCYNAGWGVFIGKKRHGGKRSSAFCSWDRRTRV
ncbi:MAG: transposase [Thermodesulfobacterium sp.]|nr:transposase [Thermodesulfobacterium sp.]MBO8143854.1 transposase [Thermodesulfobacterium sp.]